MRRLSTLLLAVLLAACSSGSPAPSPVLISVAPARWSRSMPTTMTVSGTSLDAIPTVTPWAFPGCDVASYTGAPVSAAEYRLVLTPGPKAAIGDVCSLRLDLTGQVLPAAFETWL